MGLVYFAYIWLIFMVIVGEYTIHGSYGCWRFRLGFQALVFQIPPEVRCLIGMFWGVEIPPHQVFGGLGSFKNKSTTPSTTSSKCPSKIVRLEDEISFWNGPFFLADMFVFGWGMGLRCAYRNLRVAVSCEHCPRVLTIMIMSKLCEISPWSLAKKNPQSMRLKGHVAPVTIFCGFQTPHVFFLNKPPPSIFGSFGTKALVTRSIRIEADATIGGFHHWASGWNRSKLMGAGVTHRCFHHRKKNTASHMQMTSFLHWFITGWWLNFNPFEKY